VRQTDLSSLSTRLYDDRLRVLRAGGSYDYVDSLSAINRFETQFSKGFNWDAGSSVNARSTTGSPVFIKGTALVSRLQPVYGPFEVYVTASGQWSANKLLAAEQFGLGGATFGSAYDPSELVGDSGIAARLELQYNQTLDFKYVPNYQLYGFYDGGVVWNRDAFASVKSSSSLTSTGLGLRFNVLEQVTGSLEFAEPLTHRVAANGADGYGPRVFFSLAYRY
jgi:hemolysin activation/secretion protein